MPLSHETNRRSSIPPIPTFQVPPIKAEPSRICGDIGRPQCFQTLTHVLRYSVANLCVVPYLTGPAKARAQTEIAVLAPSHRSPKIFRPITTAPVPVEEISTITNRWPGCPSLCLYLIAEAIDTLLFWSAVLLRIGYRCSTDSLVPRLVSHWQRRSVPIPALSNDVGFLKMG